MTEKFIDEEFLSFLQENKGIVSVGFTKENGFPEATPLFVVEAGDDYLCFIVRSKIVERMKNSKGLAISIFDWNASKFLGYQLKANFVIYPSQSDYAKEIISKFDQRRMTPSFLNTFANEMNEKLIIPQKRDYVVKADIELKYSVEPKPESAKPIMRKI